VLNEKLFDFSFPTAIIGFFSIRSAAHLPSLSTTVLNRLFDTFHRNVLRFSLLADV
jgi:hypothetical protein